VDLDKNPLVSIVAVSYNHAEHIEDAIKSLLSQDYSPLEIIISDDNSTDNSYEIAEKLVAAYRSPHKIVLNKNLKNLGIGGNVSAALQLTAGDLLISADCDDISVPNRVSKLVSLWKSKSIKPYLITSDAWDTTLAGEDLQIKKCSNLEDIHSLEDWIRNKPLFFGCTNMYTRDLINKFGLISKECGATDQIMVLRAILLGGALSFHEPLVHHRQGGVTGNKPMNVQAKINKLIKDSSRTIADIEQHIKDAEKFELGNFLRKFFKNRLAEAKLTPQALGENSLANKIRAIIAERDTPYLKKLRLFTYILLPLFHRVAYKIKRELNK